MKIRVFILSIFIMALSIMPCSDNMPLKNFFTLQNTISHTTADTHDHDHLQKTDLCSPFCSCNCCGSTVASIFVPEIFAFLPIAVISKEQKTLYTNPEYYNYTDNIWQPPKIKT